MREPVHQATKTELPRRPYHREHALFVNPKPEPKGVCGRYCVSAAKNATLVPSGEIT
jgi:hypothetical protein